VVGVGILQILGIEVGSFPTKAGAAGGQIEQSDLRAVGLGDGSGWQELAYRLVKLGLALGNHLGQHESGEGLGDGSDFEDGVGSGGAISEDAADAVVDNAD